VASARVALRTFEQENPAIEQENPAIEQENPAMPIPALLAILSADCPKRQAPRDLR
jgi:hypothetical protein